MAFNLLSLCESFLFRNMQSLQERIKKESEFYSKNQKEMQKLLENRQKLDAQISDNNLVKSVLDDLEGIKLFL